MTDHIHSSFALCESVRVWGCEGEELFLFSVVQYLHHQRKHILSVCVRSVRSVMVSEEWVQSRVCGVSVSVEWRSECEECEGECEEGEGEVWGVSVIEGVWSVSECEECEEWV